MNNIRYIVSVAHLNQFYPLNIFTQNNHGVELFETSKAVVMLTVNQTATFWSHDLQNKYQMMTIDQSSHFLHVWNWETTKIKNQKIIAQQLCCIHFDSKRQGLLLDIFNIYTQQFLYSKIKMAITFSHFMSSESLVSYGRVLDHKKCIDR